MSSTLYTKRYTEPHGRHRKKRPQTFVSEAAAKKYAEVHKIKKYHLLNLQPYKKIPKIRIMVV